MARVEGSKTIKVKLKKLKAGSLAIPARGSDANGNPVNAQTTVRVKK